MARIYPLFSSSSGNACFVGSPDSGILIDCGASCRKIITALERCHISAEAVKAIFITHDHSDHINGLRVFTKARPMPVYASKATLRYLENSDMLSPGCETDEVGETGVEACGFFVRAYRTPHDAMESVFYKIVAPDGKTVCVCTDLGTVTPKIDSELLGSDAVLLESNYDEDMLRLGPYPPALKKRIAGGLGHLSNPDSAKEVRRLVEHGTRRIILGHLSQHNNAPEVAESTHVRALGGFRRNADYILKIAPVETDGWGMSF